MILTIWRHGEAGSAASDQLRELTARGHKDVEHGAQQFLRSCAHHSIAIPEKVYHSSWLRTTQTAGIICEVLDQAIVQDAPALLPDGNVLGVDNWLTHLSDDSKHLLLVSHQPLVSRLADHYLGEYGLVPSLPPGGLVTLSLEVPARACAQLLFWALPPDYRPSV